MRTKKSASEFLEQLDERLTLGAALAGIRECDEQSLTTFSKRLGISRQHLCDIEQGRKVVSAERAARFARALKHPEAVFVKLALDDTLRAAKLKYAVELHAVSAS